MPARYGHTGIWEANLASFLGALLLATGSLLVVAAPVFVLAWRRQRLEVAGKFLIAAIAIGLFFAVGSAGSERLVDSCRNAGGYYCLDAGFTGFLLLIGLIYLMAVARAIYTLWS